MSREKVYNTHKLAVTMARPERDGRQDAHSARGHLCREGLKPLTSVYEVPEPEYTKVCLTVEALLTTEPHESVIDVQRKHRIPLAVMGAQETGDCHAMK